MLSRYWQILHKHINKIPIKVIIMLKKSFGGIIFPVCGLTLCIISIIVAMKSIKELYRIGTGPSSSHTMGPRKAAEIYLKRHPVADGFRVTLYGSLAATGKGHMTNVAITDVLWRVAPVELIWQPKVFLPFHPNGMKFAALDKDGNEIDPWTVFSIGGGALAEENDSSAASINTPDVYEMNHLSEILAWCERTGKSYWEYVQECEESDIWDYLREVWRTMQESVVRGLDAEQGFDLLHKGEWLPGFVAVAWVGVCLCAGCERGKCFGRHDCHCSHLWLVWCGAGCAVSLAA